MQTRNVDADVMIRNWWVLLVRGAMAVLFGILALVAPGISLKVLVLAFGAYAFIDGLMEISHAMSRRSGSRPWGLLTWQGLLGIGAGIVTLMRPGLTAIALLYLIATWSVLGGIAEIAMAFRLRKTITGEAWLMLTGVVSLGLGVALALFPGMGALALVLWFGAYAVAAGVTSIALSLRLHAWAKAHEPTSHGRGGMQPPTPAASRG